MSGKSSRVRVESMGSGEGEERIDGIRKGNTFWRYYLGKERRRRKKRERREK